MMMMMIVMMMSKVLMTITLHLCLWIAWDFHYVPLPLLSLAMPEKTIDYFCFTQLYYVDFETLIIILYIVMWRQPIIVQGTWARIDASPLGLLLSQWREVVLTNKAPNAPRYCWCCPWTSCSSWSASWKSRSAAERRPCRPLRLVADLRANVQGDVQLFIQN